MIRRAGVTLASILLISGATDAGNLIKISEANLSFNLAENNSTKQHKKMAMYTLPQKILEPGIDINARAGKITYFLENEDSSLLMQSLITSRGSYIKAIYGRGNSRLDFLARILFINPSRIIKGETPLFSKPEVTVEAKFSFPLYLPF